MFANPMNNYPGHVDRKYLTPMYERLFSAYQKNSAKNSMWFEPVQFPDGTGTGPVINF